MDMLDLILHIEKRPALYISKNYISCLKSFLDGCIFSNPDITNSHILVDFEIFVKEKYKITSSQSWSDIIIFYSIDENDALNNFFHYFMSLLTYKFIFLCNRSIKISLGYSLHITENYIDLLGEQTRKSKKMVIDYIQSYDLVRSKNSAIPLNCMTCLGSLS